MNLRSATLQVLPRMKLPLQERWQREMDAQRIRPGSGPQKPLPAHEDPYRILEVPMLDETLSSQWSNGPGAAHKPTLVSSTLLAGDFLGLSGSVFGTVSSQGHNSPFRGTLGRRMPDARDQGSLRPTEFQFGEVLDPGINLVSGGSIGTGAFVTNVPLQLADAFDHHSFQGNLPPGWQVEIYRNQALLAFQADRPDGRYEFLNLPLSFGLNDFRLVFYGPQGNAGRRTITSMWARTRPSPGSSTIRPWASKAIKSAPNPGAMWMSATASRSSSPWGPPTQS